MAEEIQREPTQLYLISPLEVGGDFPERLKRALAAAPVAAFQFRVKDMDEHAAADLAAPLQKICAEAGTAFIVNDSISLAKRLDAEKRVAALEHEVRTLADVGQRLTDQLTKVLYCVAT